MLCILAALVTLLALWGMVAAFSWQPLRLGLLLPALAVSTFVAFAMLMLTLALAPPQNLTFDAKRRQIRGSARRSLGLPRFLQLDFKALSSPKLHTFTQESGDTFYQIRISAAKQPAILIGAFSEHQDAQHWRDRLADLIAHDLKESQ